MATTDEHARRSFGRYWRLIHPGSALIRSGLAEGHPPARRAHTAPDLRSRKSAPTVDRVRPSGGLALQHPMTRPSRIAKRPPPSRAARRDRSSRCRSCWPPRRTPSFTIVGPAAGSRGPFTFTDTPTDPERDVPVRRWELGDGRRRLGAAGEQVTHPTGRRARQSGALTATEGYRTRRRGPSSRRPRDERGPRACDGHRGGQRGDCNSHAYGQPSRSLQHRRRAGRPLRSR